MAHLKQVSLREEWIQAQPNTGEAFFYVWMSLPSIEKGVI